MRGAPKESPGAADARAKKTDTKYSRDENTSETPFAQLYLVDRFGNLHTQAAVEHWSSALQAAMGLRLADEVDGGSEGTS